MSGYEARRIRSQENCGAHKFLQLAEPAHGSASDELLTARCAVEQAFIQIGAKNAGRNGIHADSVLRPLHGQGLGQRHHTSLAGSIRRNLIKSAARSYRSDVDDAAIFSLDHFASENLAGP